MKTYKVTAFSEKRDAPKEAQRLLKLADDWFLVVGGAAVFLSFILVVIWALGVA